MKHVKLFEAWSQGQYTFKAISVFPEGGSSLYVGVFTQEFGEQTYNQLSKVGGLVLRMIDLPEGDDVVVSELGGEGLTSGRSSDLGWDNLVRPGEEFEMDNEQAAIPFAVDRSLGAFVGVGGFGQTEVVEVDELLASFGGSEEMEDVSDESGFSNFATCFTGDAYGAVGILNKSQQDELRAGMDAVISKYPNLADYLSITEVDVTGMKYVLNDASGNWSALPAETDTENYLYHIDRSGRSVGSDSAENIDERLFDLVKGSLLTFDHHGATEKISVTEFLEKYVGVGTDY
jgi:hypothetical protein